MHTCTVCGKSFAAKRAHASYCSSTCRGRAMKQRRNGGGSADVVQMPSASSSASSAGSPESQLVAAVRRQLTDAKKIDTYLGQQALVLAQALRPESMDTGSAKASLSKELDRLMTALLADYQEDRDELDEIQGQVVEMRSRRRA